MLAETINGKNRINHGAAELNREKLAGAGVAAITLCGGPGCGKTALLIETIKHLNAELRTGVILGNIRAEGDASHLQGWCSQVACIETVDLNASLVRESLERLDLSKLDLVFIERASAVPPTPSDLGQSATVGMFSVSGGDDKVLRYPERVEYSDLVLLTKCDLLSIVPFDRRQFTEAIVSVKPGVNVMTVSATDHSGMTAWCDWVRGQVRKVRPEGEPSREAGCEPGGEPGCEPDRAKMHADYFFG